MALTRDRKQEVITEVSNLLASSRLTVVASYSGTSVKDMQSLRRQAQGNGTAVKVVKNRLVKQAMARVEHFKSVDYDLLTGQLLYAFNAEDEVAPAQALATFARTNPNLVFVGAFTADGSFIGTDDVKSLAALPGKQQLRGMLIGTVAAPLSGFVHVLAGNVRGVLNILSARAEAIK